MVSIEGYLTPLHRLSSTNIHIETLGGHWSGTGNVNQSQSYILVRDLLLRWLGE